MIKITKSIQILLYILIIVGTILGTVAFVKVLSDKSNNCDTNKNNDTHIEKGLNDDKCHYCRTIDGNHYHHIDGKIYKRPNYKKSGKMCDICMKYSVHKQKQDNLTQKQVTHYHYIDNH